MAELKIKADSGGGTVSLKGPATTTDDGAIQLTLPVNDGDAGQYLKTDGSGALSWATVDSTPEGTAVKSTTNSNEASTKFLRADGDGTCSWQIPPAATTTSGTDNFTVADGNLVIGTAGHGVDFSANTASNVSGASMTSELLDWYEEGTWTPAFTGTTWSSFTTQTGTYTRCGAIVVAHGWIVADTSNQSGNGGAHVGGLPYQMSYNSASNRGAVTFGYSKNIDLTGDKRQLTGTIVHNGSSFSMHNLEDNGSPFTNYEQNFNDTVELSFTCVYTTGVN